MKKSIYYRSGWSGSKGLLGEVKNWVNIEKDKNREQILDKVESKCENRKKNDNLQGKSMSHVEGDGTK